MYWGESYQVPRRRKTTMNCIPTELTINDPSHNTAVWRKINRHIWLWGFVYKNSFLLLNKSLKHRVVFFFFLFQLDVSLIWDQRSDAEIYNSKKKKKCKQKTEVCLNYGLRPWVQNDLGHVWFFDKIPIPHLKFAPSLALTAVPVASVHTKHPFNQHDHVSFPVCVIFFRYISYKCITQTLEILFTWKIVFFFCITLIFKSDRNNPTWPHPASPRLLLLLSHVWNSFKRQLTPKKNFFFIFKCTKKTQQAWKSCAFKSHLLNPLHFRTEHRKNTEGGRPSALPPSPAESTKAQSVSGSQRRRSRTGWTDRGRQRDKCASEPPRRRPPPPPWTTFCLSHAADQPLWSLGSVCKCPFGRNPWLPKLIFNFFF